MRAWIVMALFVVVACDKESAGDGAGAGVELGKIGGGKSKEKTSDEAKPETRQEAADDDGAGANPLGAFGEAKRKTACVEAQMLLHASEMFQVMEGRAPKDVGELKAKGTIPEARDDPWGNAYAIDGAGPKVTSAGPDETMGTEDDIVVASGEPDPC